VRWKIRSSSTPSQPPPTTDPAWEKLAHHPIGTDLLTSWAISRPTPPPFSFAITPRLCPTRNELATSPFLPSQPATAVVHVPLLADPAPPRSPIFILPRKTIVIRLRTPLPHPPPPPARTISPRPPIFPIRRTFPPYSFSQSHSSPLESTGSAGPMRKPRRDGLEVRSLAKEATEEEGKETGRRKDVPLSGGWVSLAWRRLGMERVGCGKLGGESVRTGSSPPCPMERSTSRQMRTMVGFCRLETRRSSWRAPGVTGTHSRRAGMGSGGVVSSIGDWEEQGETMSRNGWTRR
jgi:hypothetical protein